MPNRARISKYRLDNRLVDIGQDVSLRYSRAFQFLEKPKTLKLPWTSLHCSNVMWSSHFNQLLMVTPSSL